MLSEERESLPEKRKKLEIQRIKTAYAQKELHITSLLHNLIEFKLITFYRILST
jgi:hypothetical protein